MHAPGPGGEVADEGCQEAGRNCGITQAADGQHFNAEYSTGQRRSKDRSEAGADAGHEQDAAVAWHEVKRAGELVGERCSGLDGGAFASS
jgi:hypothetical protein